MINLQGNNETSEPEGEYKCSLCGEVSMANEDEEKETLLECRACGAVLTNRSCIITD